MNNLNKNNSKYFDFQNKKFKFLENNISRKNNIFFKIKNRSSKILSTIADDCRIYCDFDFSVAGSGYVRDPHHDQENRILNFLLYVNDFNGSNGGNFQTYKYKNTPKTYLREPLLGDLSMINNIKPQKGYFVTFLSSPNSLHGVDRILPTNEKRYFFT